MSHDTWNSYQSMLRILKNYRLPLRRVPKGAPVAAVEMSFSGYPGVIYSGDDFTVTSAGLTVLETTIGNNNKALWGQVKPRGSVLEGIRATVANRLATDGKSWTGVFSRFNSGTYNNQWMVVDNKLFRPHQQQLSPGLFWVLEQIPGYVRRKDLTSVLQTRTFWPSYNSPYFTGESLSINPSTSTDLVIQTCSTRVGTLSLSRSTETGFHTIKLQELLYSPGM